ncbi:MAG: SAM-dependent methyltransferase, partial [Trebonia sp.]
MTTFLGRAVHYLAGEVGIDQFIAIGRGLVAMENVHQVAQRSFPRARVVYVDNDPAAVPHAEALLTTTTGVSVISEDFRKPERVLVRTGRTLDLSRPVALILAEIAHFIPDSGEPGELVRRYVDSLAPGSHLVLTHAYLTAALTLIPRVRAETDQLEA